MVAFALLALVPVAVGVLAGYLTGGRLTVLAGRLHALWLLWAAVAVQAAQYHLPGAVRLGLPALAVVFGIVLAWLAVNLRRWPPPGRWAAGLAGCGGLLNGLAIAVNGRMPYAPGAAGAAGLPVTGTTAKNEPAGPGTRLALLGDVFPVPPLHKVVSAGDVLIAIGAALLVVALMRTTPAPSQRRKVHRDPNQVPPAGTRGRLRPGHAGHPALHDRRAAALHLMISRRPRR